MAILEQPGPAQLQGQRGSCIPVTLGWVELVPLAPCSRQRGGGREQDRHCTPSPSSRSSLLPRSGLCSHLTGIKSKFGQRHLPPEPHDLPEHQLHCKAQRGHSRGKQTPRNQQRGHSWPPAPALLCSQHSQRGGKQDSPIRALLSLHPKAKPPGS